ncbi:Lipoamide acyltransferase component of branched-chain alpha-keto acid dehydrogenase complex [Cardinium endosymbiont cEper1 of Encarsia pergandiella]|uniref:dihydrolipoamide acetyltransferase family protein n=1 Tax=Cardinium endosymbiont of Encarsia pergandiella TaxID=249402 RepID=UPI00027E9AE9|nr:dihydrolipoamide acetyltransferase family protein [Cardinium endosymbiont of Encarsia pergandiella]CCM09951.1 Lipoamide acyltransferase component of branched-chain alpha-keto acid dehydrogenase complex [Cardinium endosymbiont cEper1 of Encarsia pergandiella]
MSLITLYLPKMGESVIEVVVLDWCIQEGEAVVEGAPLLGVATDKVDAEIPATYTGTIKKLLVKKGDVLAIGAPIALLEVDHLDVPPVLHQPENAKPSLVAIPRHLEPSVLAIHPFKKVKLSPLASHIAQANAIQADELAKLAGYTRDHRVTKEALLNYISKRLPIHTSSSERPLFCEALIPLAGDEVVQMDRVRKLIADRMVQSKKIAPHVTSFIRADVTELVAWRQQHKISFEAKYGARLTYNPIFIAVIARALQLFPLLNAVVVNDHIIKRKHINIGFAVARSDGNLLVPVVKQVEQLGLVALAQQIDGLIDQARNGTIMPDALTGASYTISNIGSFDNLMGTPIIVQPQVAILALGLIEKRPAVVHVKGNETIAIRDELFLSHTYDHRIIDGAIGGGFLKYLAKALASFVAEIDTYPFI